MELDFDDLDAVAGGAGGGDAVEIDGQIVEVLPNAMFQVQLDNGSSALCHISGKLRQNFIRLLVGNRVRVQTNPGDSSKGRVVWRYE